MFGIGGGEMIFIIFIALMLFGSDKIPMIARGLGKGMAQLKNATNEIKSEIHKSAEEHGINDTINDIKGSINNQVNNIKDGLGNENTTLNNTFRDLTSNFANEAQNIKDGIDQSVGDPMAKAKEDIEQATGPVKRQM